jgi:hypothetical protein
MVYSAGFVSVIKVNGKILRENKDKIFLPFNSEYSLLLKNLESRKSLIKITIDGQDVLDGNSLILNPNSEMELEGFMKGMIAKNKFKFIKKTQQISDYRGDRVDDGIIRIEYWFEQFVEKSQVITEVWTTKFNCNGNCINCYQNCFNRKYYWYNNGTYSVGSSENSFRGVSDQSLTSIYTSMNIGNSANTIGDLSKKSHDIYSTIDEGITVKGNETDQHFNYGIIGKLEDQSRVIILKLIGSENGKIIEEPITIKTKKTCSTCGKKCKSHMKFCSNCGTFLE